MALSHAPDYENIAFEHKNLSPETQEKSITGAGRMGQWLRAHTAFQEDWSWVPNACIG